LAAAEWPLLNSSIMATHGGDYLAPNLPQVDAKHTWFAHDVHNNTDPMRNRFYVSVDLRAMDNHAFCSRSCKYRNGRG